MHLDVGIHPGVSSRDYHQDPCGRPSLNSTIAKILCSKSPAHAHMAHPKLGGGNPIGHVIDPDEPEKKEKVSRAKLLGSLMHRLLLNAGGEIVVCPFDNWRKADAKAMRAEALAAGNIPTLPSIYDEAVIGAASARKQLDDMGLDYVFRDGLKEVTLVWKEGELPYRAMLDQLVIDETSKKGEIWDLKTVGRSSHPEACAAQITNMGYDLSACFYKQGLQSLRPDLIGRTKFYWAFMEVEPPYSITPVEIDGEWEASAFQHYCNAADAWRKCITANRWPHYVDKITRLQPKPWMLTAAMGAEIAGNLE